jgi:Na+/H+ antiporter NhaD/arsenite permease-like protein
VDVALVGIIFIVTYALIATERVDKTVAALFGGSLVVILGLVSSEDAFAAIDLNVILLLAGMMVLAGMLGRTGFFAWLAIRSVKAVRGDPVLLLLVLSTICGVLSAFLDNVTTVVLIAPVTIYVANLLKVSPLPFLISEILASNIGGAATLIGDPPNILIGSAAGLGFEDFLIHLAPIVVIVFSVLLVMLRRFFAAGLRVDPEVRDAVLAIDERESLTDPPLLRLTLVVIGLTMVGFLLAKPLGYEAGVAAVLGAATLMLLTRADAAVALREVEWSTLFFFIGLFMLVESIVHVGIVDAAADGLVALTGGDDTVTTLGLLWLSGVASAIVDNIPYTATMLPVVERLGAAGIPIEPLWWSLALGACFGGNATIIGASANVVVADIARREGHPIGFGMFLRFGAVVTVMSLLISTVYLYGRYLS